MGMTPMKMDSETNTLGLANSCISELQTIAKLESWTYHIATVFRCSHKGISPLPKLYHNGYRATARFAR